MAATSMPVALMFRQCMIRMGVVVVVTCSSRKVPGTALEDAILMEHVNTHGEGNWNSVSRCTGLARCGKSCRLRWSNLKKGAFSPDEERIIVETDALFGNKWARMAVLLPVRTDNEIKNYWNTRVKRHQHVGIPLYPPHVHHDPPAKRGLHHQCAKPASSAPESFTFQSPTTSPYDPLHSPSTPISKPLFPTSSTPPFPCSFTFQTQPFINQPTSTPTTPTHIASPSTNAPTTTSLPLFNFPIHTRSPPTLVRSPMRFRRFPSFSLPPITTTASVCSLLAEITHQQQLPSIQILPPGNHNNHNADSRDRTLKLGLVSSKFLQVPTSTGEEEEPRRGRAGTEEEEEDGFMFIEDDDLLVHDGLLGSWNHFDSFSQCLGMGQNGESTRELNITIPEDLTSLVNSMTSPAEPSTHSNAGGATSDDLSPALAGEKTDVLETHRIASLFSSAVDHDRATLDNCSWENLSELRQCL